MAINLLNVDPTELLTLLKEAYYDATGETLTIGSAEFAIGSTQSYVWSILLNEINEATRNRFVDYASGEFLDALAANYGITERPEGYKATALFLVTASSTAITVPANSIVVATDGGLRFTNPYDVEIVTGASIILQAVESGEKYNGIPAGEIKNVIEGEIYLGHCVNTTMSAGGTESFVGDDEAYREWLKVQIQTYAGAGTYMAYEAKALNSDSRILDSYVLKQTDAGYQKGKVQIFILSDPTTDLSGQCVQIAQEACSDPSFRPVGDLVVVAYSGEETKAITATIQTVYPSRFKSAAIDRTSRIIKEYKEYLLDKINRPFIFEDLCARLTATDEDGVYAVDAKPVGITAGQYTQPVYPSAGKRIKIESLPFTVYYTDKE